MTNVTKVVHRRDFIKFSALMYMQKEFVLNSVQPQVIGEALLPTTSGCSVAVYDIVSWCNIIEAQFCFLLSTVVILLLEHTPLVQGLSLSHLVFVTDSLSAQRTTHH
uniref:Uncharacterized protein n=1 Tax=Solanum lycopersicum TaxID=4081 RepID=A0A3Q7FB95_SOLLC